MNIRTLISGSKNKISREHWIYFTETEILAIRVVNNIFNEITDCAMHDDLVYFEDESMVMDDLMSMSSMLNSIVDYIDTNKN